MNRPNLAKSLTPSSPDLTPRESLCLQISQLWGEIAEACRAAAKTAQCCDLRDMRFTQQQAEERMDEKLKEIDGLTEKL